ncbi:hypothetical protein [Alkanindiges illinoisensis]|uniref:hypothetical protein n=1 Tax=Alkanindiges illinoisensis TaxID=197183 RepID=UPI001419D622|nr:hypothetical protein [Alkanindiges illinoisensis]
MIKNSQPPKITYSNSDLVLLEENERLKSSRDFWRFMFFAAVFCYGLVLWGLGG